MSTKRTRRATTKKQDPPAADQDSESESSYNGLENPQKNKQVKFTNVDTESSSKAPKGKSVSSPSPNPIQSQVKSGPSSFSSLSDIQSLTLILENDIAQESERLKNTIEQEGDTFGQLATFPPLSSISLPSNSKTDKGPQQDSTQMIMSRIGSLETKVDKIIELMDKLLSTKDRQIMDRKPVQTLIKNKMRMNMYITFNEIDNEVFELYKKEYETKDVFLSANTSWIVRFISSKRGRTVEKIKGAIERNYRITDENRVQLLEEQKYRKTEGDKFGNTKFWQVVFQVFSEPYAGQIAFVDLVGVSFKENMDEIRSYYTSLVKHICTLKNSKSLQEHLKTQL